MYDAGKSTYGMENPTYPTAIPEAARGRPSAYLALRSLLAHFGHNHYDVVFQRVG